MLSRGAIARVNHADRRAYCVAFTSYVAVSIAVVKNCRACAPTTVTTCNTWDSVAHPRREHVVISWNVVRRMSQCRCHAKERDAPLSPLRSCPSDICCQCNLCSTIAVVRQAKVLRLPGLGGYEKVQRQSGYGVRYWGMADFPRTDVHLSS